MAGALSPRLLALSVVPPLQVSEFGFEVRRLGKMEKGIVVHVKFNGDDPQTGS